MSNHARPLPPILGATFRTRDARALGVTPGRLGAADLEAPFRGVRITAEPERPPLEDGPLALDARARADILRRARALAVILPPYAFFIGDAARAVVGLPLESGSDAQPIEVGVLAPHRAIRRPGVRSVQVAPALASVRTVDGLRVASPATLWALTGRDATTRELIVLVDALVRVPRTARGLHLPERQLATIDQLAAALAAGRRRGADRLRDALACIRVGSMSPLETDARLLLEEAALPEPLLDHEVRGHDGRLLGISDRAYARRRVAVEVEGDHHRTSREQWNRDLEKYADYAAAGWDVVRLSAAHIRSPRPAAAGLVRRALEVRGWA